jgi:hypothetical protein
MSFAESDSALDVPHITMREKCLLLALSIRLNSETGRLFTGDNRLMNDCSIKRTTLYAGFKTKGILSLRWEGRLRMFRLHLFATEVKSVESPALAFPSAEARKGGRQ